MSSSPARYFPGIFARRNGARDQSADSVERVAGDCGAAETAAAEVSDEALIARLQKKDVEALGLLYRRYARLIYTVCFRILRSSSEAEDLVHEVFLCLYRRCKSFDPAKGAARSWLIQLAYSRCFDWRDYLRARHGQKPGDTSAEAHPVDIPSPRQEWDPGYFILWNPRMTAAFHSLSEEQQMTLRLHYLEGYTFQEIAEELGYTYGNVKHHVYRGMERLRHVLFDGAGQLTAGAARLEMRAEPKEMAG